MTSSKPGDRNFQWKFRIFFWSIFILLLLILLSLHFFMALAYEQTIEILTRVQSMESTVEKLQMKLETEEGVVPSTTSDAVAKPIK